MRLRCFARRERPAPRKSTETSRCNGDPMFRRLLIANRGEIAIRVERTAREMGIRCIGVYSEADRAALHRAAMDETVLIGGPLPVDSYLNIDHVLRAAEEARVDAVHPGYGFLSENPAFATTCAEAGLVFFGPPPDAMAVAGDKIAARKSMAEEGVAVTRGVDQPLRSLDEARIVASEVGYPVLFKATAGGGGIGMSRVDRPAELTAAFESARSVALANFGNPDLFLEKYLRRARHVEVQVLLDSRDAVGFVERECSVQRRHQKLVEETPSPAVTRSLRSRLIDTAVRGLRAIGYREPTGPGVRVDSGVAAGSLVPPYYDPLMAKLVVHAPNRRQAIEHMRRNIDAFEVRGVNTNLPFHRALLRRSEFVQGNLWTTMVADLRIAARLRSRGPWEERFAAIAAAFVASGRAARGPTFPLERPLVTRWSSAGRKERLSGGGHAVSPRRRW